MKNNYLTPALLLTLLLLITFTRQTHAQTIAGGFRHSLFVCTDGTAQACGFNYYGQLGDGSTTTRTTPVQVNGMIGITAVAGGEDHSLFLMHDGTVWACGKNYSGQLGDGTTTDRNTPVQVGGLTGIIAVAAGEYHSLFLKHDGTVWVCGNNYYGQLGDGTTTDRITPVQVSGMTGIAAVAGGKSHSLFLKHDGTVWAVGRNVYGQLGDGTTTDRTIPVQVIGMMGITAVDAGYHHSLFLKNDGTAWACGWNNKGQLGDGTTTNSTTPVQVSGMTDIIAVAVGPNHSLFLKHDGTVWACGNNYYGQLGDGTTTDRTAPIQVSGATGITAVAAGGRHSLFLKNTGTVWACGNNSPGQLGDGTTTDRTTPVQTIGLCQVAQPPIYLYPHNVNGYLYNDANANCSKDSVEQSLLHFAVRATPGYHYAFSNDTGYYSLGVYDSVNYTIEPIIPARFSNMISNPCPANYLVFLDSTAPFDTSGFNFGFDYNPCAVLRVGVSSNRRRRCFRNITSISYWNEGLSDTTGVEIHVKMPEHVIPVSASMPYTWSSDSNIVFNIDTLKAGQWETITIIDSVACINGITGLTQCTRAWITPANPCLMALDTAGGSWDKSSVAVEGDCIRDSIVEFVIYNTGDPGNGDMAGTSEYRIYADGQLVHTGSFQLAGGDSLVLQINADGQTIRLEADQHPGHPGFSNPQATIEACGESGGTFSLGFVSQLPMDDQDLHVEEDCLPIIDSYDPNDKQVSPGGITANNYVKPSSLLDYKIRFQNTGSDTAYKVVVVDTLSEHLDLATLELGAASFPYQIALSGEGKPVLSFTFNNINLPDSATNELNSQGFVKFKIAPYDTVPIGIVINNVVDIYFDFNLPIRTNTAWVTIHDTTLTGAMATVIRCDTTTAPLLAFNFQDSTICAGDPIQIMASGADAYHWYEGDSISSRMISDPLVYPVIDQMYRLEAASNSSCYTAIDSVQVLVNSLPAVLANASSATLCDGESTTLSGSGAQSYSWNGGVDDGVAFSPTSSAVYTVTGTDANNCSDTASIAISVNPVYTENNTAEICFGGSYTLPGGNVVSVEDVYYDTLQTIQSCDSVIITTLTVNTVDVSVTQSSDTLLAINPNASYEWFNCNNATPPAGNINDQTFVATENGDYGVILSENGCVDTSACYSITSIGIIENDFNSSLAVYPNPASEKLNIDLGGYYPKVTVSVQNMQGKLLIQQNFDGQQLLELNLGDLANGVYTVNITAGEKKAVVKVVKGR